MTLEITPAEQQVLIDSLRGSIHDLYEASEAYRDGGNKEAQMDCLEEKRKVQRLLDKILTL